MDYSNSIAEEYVASAILNQPEVYIPLLKGEGVDQSSFHLHLPKLIWRSATALFSKERIHEIEMLEYSDSIKGSPNGRELTVQISAIRSQWAGDEFFKTHLATLKLEQGRRIAHIAASEALTRLSGGDTAQEVSETLRSGSEAITGILSNQSDFKSAKQSTEEFTKLLSRIHSEGTEAGIPTGITLIDNLTGGLRDAALWVVAAPTSGGKTVLMLQMLANVLALGKRAVMFSLETDAEYIHARLASCTQSIPMGKILGNHGHTLIKSDLIRIKRYVEDLVSADNLTICDSDSLTLDDIEAKLRQLDELGGFDCVCIDYIQLVEVSGAKDLARHEQIAKVTRTLKQLAKRYKCPIVTASQLNDDGRLRESRAIGHDADVVLIIDPPEGEIGVAKNRSGEKGARLPLVMNGNLQRFE